MKENIIYLDSLLLNKYIETKNNLDNIFISLNKVNILQSDLLSYINTYSHLIYDSKNLIKKIDEYKDYNYLFSIELKDDNVLFFEKDSIDNYLDKGIYIINSENNKKVLITKENNYSLFNNSIQVNVKIETDLNLNKEGNYYYKYIISSKNINLTLEKTRIIKIIKKSLVNILILGNNPLLIQVNDNLDDYELNAIAYDDNNNILDVITENNINTNILGEYKITYSAKDNNNNEDYKTRIVKVLEKIDLKFNLINENPIIWNINSEYREPGLEIVNTYNNKFNKVVYNNINTEKIGIYNYTYNIIDEFKNITEIVRVIYILDYTVLDNVPIINMEKESTDNVINILKLVESTDYFKNDELALSDDFAIHFKNKQEKYRIPLNILKDMYSSNNNMIILVYGFTNEVINVIKCENNMDYEFPYITDKVAVKKLVNLVLNNKNNYKLIILDGKHNSLLNYKNPYLELKGNNNYLIDKNTNFLEPGFIAKDYNNKDINVDIYNNIDNSKNGNYEIIYIANDNEGNQTIKSRQIDVN